MRRRHGTGLTRNELKVLAAALRLAYEGVVQLYGYELFRTLTTWEGDAPMNHGTLYRCLRSLEERQLLLRHDATEGGGAPRVRYELTASGRAAAGRATVQLAALDQPPPWIDLGVVSRAADEG